MSEPFSLKRRKTQKMAQRKLEDALRAFEGWGVRFRRKAAKGSEIVDFISDEARVVVELDVSETVDERQAQYNAQRIAFLRSRGYQFLRFWSTEIVQNEAQVMATIIAVLRLQQEKFGDQEKFADQGGADKGGANKSGADKSGAASAGASNAPQRGTPPDPGAPGSGDIETQGTTPHPAHEGDKGLWL